MQTKQKRNGTAMSVPGGLAAAVTVSVTVTVAACAILAKLIDLELLEWENIGYAIMATLLTAAFAGGVTAAVKIKHRRLFMCMSAGTLYWVAMLCIAAVAFGGRFESAGVSGAVILAGSACAALLNGEKRGRGVRKKYRFAR